MREGEKKNTSQKMKKIFKNRWMFPAVYLMSAAILISGIIWYQMADTNNEQGQESQEGAIEGQFNQPAEEVNSSVEQMALPMKNADEAVVKTGFYDEKASEKQQEAALVVYNNTYHPNTGIAYTAKGGKTFDVTAALSGKVTKVQENDALLGNVIVIEHADGFVTNYQSVKDIQVAEGDQVSQGDVIAKAGKSLFNEKAGVHLHFEVRKDNVAINPLNCIDKTVAAIEESIQPAQTKESADKATEESAEQNEESTDKATEESTEQTEESPSEQEQNSSTIENELEDKSSS
ncbi:peptidoglycan DD-metalloendopeptidase family protein [Bacillus aerolatus]|uniref:Peptidoglycan DD-metalloendopeptidase family protein n=1 Tax=Bacillus aerolatus TaxID=2653354 RepID=A0A6I1FGY0_9BACI|nr:M23 family metallopeptidase [Bacillus aerolatus]KAB7707455.1 peptidoglycan DD-metalloendopeptidase family protein [Bacillus aerolatus]